MSDEEPGVGADNGLLPIFRRPAAVPEPGEGVFDDPSPRQELKALGGVGPLDDFQRPAADLVQHADFGLGSRKNLKILLN